MCGPERLGQALCELSLGTFAKPRTRFYRAAWLNYLGAARSGCHEPAVERFVRSRADLCAGAFAPIGHGWRLGLSDSVMANCHASSVQAFDDIHFATTTHPAGPVASAIVGVSELTDVSTTDAAEALAIGMEVECRLALALFSSGTGSAAGWYTTGMAGGVGAAAACGRLLELDVRQMESALGWAATMASGVRGTHGSAAGTFVPALAARSGLEAALLARDGLGCSLDALDGACGLVYQVAPHPALERTLRGIGRTWISRETSAKPYPFGFVAFAAVDAARELGPIACAQSIDVFVSVRAEQLGANASPATADEAIVSIPYLVARTLADPGSTRTPIPRAFEIAPEVARLMDVIAIHGDASLADGAARILVDGGVRHASCGAARGTAERRLTIEETTDKFRDISGLDDPERVIAAIMDEDVPLRSVIDLLR